MFKYEQFDDSKIQSLLIKKLIKITPPRSPGIPLNSSWVPKATCVKEIYKDQAEANWNALVRPEDVWIVTYPKSGTTWTQEMVWLLMNDMNFELARSQRLSERSLFFEIDDGVYPDERNNCFKRNLNVPQVIKSHLPASLLPKDIWKVKPKIIYIARNYKDAILSYFHHHVHIHGYNGDLDTFINENIKGNMVYDSWQDHVNDFWQMKNEEYILFLTFEELKVNLKVVIAKISEFLNKAYNPKKIEELLEHLSFENMRNNIKINKIDLVMESSKQKYNFIRKGKVGGYKDELNQEQIDKLDKKFKDNLCY